MAIKLTPKQRSLARHALGLTDGRKQSYRNRFVADAAHEDHPEWMRMVRKGAASYRAAQAMFGGSDLFWLTQAGAQAALEPGELLDPEDFPYAPPELTEARPQ
jgi:hypothetical protein